MTLVILFVFGAIVGSFLNVLALRLNSGLSLSGRSHCSHCGKRLGAHELIPILSFFLSGRRCRGCRARISWQYPLVEFGTGLVFMTVYRPEVSLFLNGLILAVFSLYIAITIYDFRHKIIPDALVYASILLSLVARVFLGGTGLDYFTGVILALFLYAIWFFSRGRAIGFGDVKLALSVGLLLGAQAGFSALVLSFWIGAVFGLGLVLFSRVKPLWGGVKKITIKSEISFAPFMVLGAWLSIVLNLDLLHVSLFK